MTRFVQHTETVILLSIYENTHCAYGTDTDIWKYKSLYIKIGKPQEKVVT